MSLLALLTAQVEPHMAAYDDQLEAAQAQARAKRAQAEADVAGAELEEKLN